MWKSTKKHINSKSIAQRGIKVLLIVLFSLAIIAITAGGVFYYHKDSIVKKLILSLNSKQKGEISFSDISFNPLVHFPNASVQLHDFLLTDNSYNDSIQKSDTIAEIKNVYMAIHISDLISGRINITKITLKDGHLNIKKYDDNSINLANALGHKNLETTKYEKDTSSIKIDTTALDIKLDGIMLKDINIKFENFTSFNPILVRINEINASIQFQNNFINLGLQSEFLLQDLPLSKKIQIENKILQVNSNLIYDQQQETLKVKKGNLKLEELDFKISGDINLSEIQNIDLIVEGDVKDVHLFRLFLSDYGLENLKSGQSYFNGTIRGSFSHSIPQMEFNFGLKNMNLALPKVNNNISNLSLQGYFNSGVKSDFSQAILRVKNLSGKLPGGSINGKFSLQNFVKPSIDLYYDMQADITGFDDIFNTNTIDSLSGKISIHNELKGEYNSDIRRIIAEKDIATIMFDSISFNIPDILQFDNLDGNIHRNMDTISFTDLKINANKTDILLNGEIYNSYYIFADEANEIWANLKIESTVFDFPEVFAYDPRTSKSFPYRILDMDLDVAVRTSTSKLTNFESNPEILFEIEKMHATIEDLFPPIIVDEGEVLLSEVDKRIHMAFSNFKISSTATQIFANVEYYSPPFDPDQVRIEAQLNGVNPGQLLLWQQDTLPSIMDGILTGNISSNLEIAQDTFDFKTFNLSTDKLIYTLKDDTIDINNLQLNAKNVIYSTLDQANILETFIADIKLQADQIGSRHFKLIELSYDIKARSGVINVIPGKNQIFGKEGDGFYKISIIDGVPVIELKYAINQFKVDDLLASMLSDTILTGKMDLNFNITMAEQDKGNFFSDMDGYIKLYGKDMIFHGLNIDDLIKKYNRSQKFSLVDVGAVILAGPVGLAVTKGSQYANLALSNKGESTPITNFISEWDINNGRIMLKDVAFATEKNRIAALGWIDLATDSLEVTIAILDKNGCDVLSQTIYGSLEDPQQSDIKVVSTVLGPITNLIDGALGKDCEVVYDGKLVHPPKKHK